MNLPLQSLIFWPVCIVTVLGALSCVFARNLLHAAFGLGVTLVGVAGLFFFLQAEYLAAIQLLVYVGGILVLLMFGVMLSKDVQGLEQRPRLMSYIVGLVAAGLVMASVTRLAASTIGYAAQSTTPESLQVTRSNPAVFQSAVTAKDSTNLGDLLMGPYLLPFLIIAVLLTVVLVGAVVLVRKEQPLERGAA